MPTSNYTLQRDNTQITTSNPLLDEQSLSSIRELVRKRVEAEERAKRYNNLIKVEPDYIKAEEKKKFLEYSDKEKNKYIIPYIPEKEIRLTSGRYNTGKISTNLLDSIYNAAKRTNTDIWTALAIAGRETTLGIGRRKPDKSIAHSDLVSNWQQYKTIHLTNREVDDYYKLQDKIMEGNYTPEEAEQYRNYTKRLRKEYNSVKPITENPLDNMYKYYKTHNPNPGDPEYKTVKIPNEIRQLKADPAIQKWYSTKAPLEKEGGIVNEITSEKQGGRFTFKKNRLLKNAEALNKKDMRKKFVKSDNPTYKRNRVNNKAKKYQVGGQLLYEDNISQPEIKVDPSIFVSWNNISTNNIELPEFDFSTPSSPNYSFIDKFNDSIIINSINKEEDKKSEEKESIKEENPSKEETPVIEEYTYKGRNQWAKDLVESYKRAGITNPNALKYLLAQDALESGWGKSAQGKYNYGNITTGSSWKGNYVQGKDKDAAGNPISQKFRSYNSLDEYTKDKINFLTRLYNFNQNDTLDIFISKLLGNNSGKRRYAEARNYGEILKNVYNSVNKYQEGGVLLFGNPETSEMLTYRMQDGSIKSVPNPGAGYVSGTDPVGQVVVEGAILNKPLGWFSSKAINWVKNLSKKIKSDKAGTINLNSSNNPGFVYHMQRLKDGSYKNVGLDKIPENSKDVYRGFNIDSPKELQEISDRLGYSKDEILRQVNDDIQILYGKEKSNIPTITYGNKTKKDLPELISHEYNHFLHNSSGYNLPRIKPNIISYEEFRDKIKNLKPEYKNEKNIIKIYNYFTDKGFTELSSRGTQVKDFLKIKDNKTPVTTKDILKAKEYFSNPVNDKNHMQEFFILFGDNLDNMAKYITTGSTAVVPLIIDNK